MAQTNCPIRGKNFRSKRQECKFYTFLADNNLHLKVRGKNYSLIVSFIAEERILNSLLDFLASSYSYATLQRKYYKLFLSFCQAENIVNIL